MWMRVPCAIAAVLVAVAGPARGQDVQPRVLSPTAGSEHVFGAQIPFAAHDQAGSCAALPEQYEWFFRVEGAAWPGAGFLFDDPQRLLGSSLIPFGCDLEPDPGDASCVLDLKKRYEVKVRMCGIDSPTVAFRVVYAPLPADPAHPSFPVDDPDTAALADGDFCYVDWGPGDANGVFDHSATEHFNVYWSASYALCGPTVTAAPPPTLPAPKAARLGLMECIYAMLDRDMLSPLAVGSLYRDAPAFAAITKLPFIAGTAVATGGGGKGEIQGLAHGPGANGPGADWVPTHELFHVFDYAGNPLHYRQRDFRFEANPYHFFHESTAVVEQATSSSAADPWGYRWDSWPAWIPLDVGLFALDYEAAPFWSYVLNRYGFTPRRSLRGPDIDACAAVAQSDALGAELKPHHYKFFEEWNAIVRADTTAIEPVTRDYVGNQCPVESHYGPIFSDGDVPENNGQLYVGQVQPACLQTLEYELSVVQDVARANAGPWVGTPLAESIQLDFAIDFARQFPPLSLLSGVPDSVLCPALPDLQLSRNFAAMPGDCATRGAPSTFPGLRADVPVCAAVDPHDFYARIEFRINDGTPKWLRLVANDSATLFVDGAAVIDGVDPFGNANSAAFPPASTTYTDQRYEFPDNHAPRSSIVPIGDPRAHRFEIEWVNHGDGRGYVDRYCDADRSRYLLEVDGYNPVTGALGPLPADDVEITRAEFWSRQGSGYEPGGPVLGVPPPVYASPAAPLEREVQLRPVSAGSRPFLLPPLAAHYHPVACPTGYVGPFEVTVRDDRLTKTAPSVHLLAMKAPAQVDWRGEVPARDEDERSATLDCDGVSEAAESADDPAFLLVSPLRTEPDVLTPYGTLGAVHYTVLAGNPGADRDADGVADYRDNCADEANANQLDAGRLGGFQPDRIGNICQCGDASNDGAVLAGDAQIVRDWLARKTTALPAGQKCNVLGPAASSPSLDCDLRDVVVLRRALEPDHLAPGLGQVCRPAVP